LTVSQLPSLPLPRPLDAGRRIAVVGSGVSGLVAAFVLSRRYEVHLFEAAPRLGGHTNTVDVTFADTTWPVDTGFIVHNRRNYPYFVRLLELLGVGTQESTMSLSVRDDRAGGLEWCGDNLNSLFAQRRNLFSPRMWGMLREVWRFDRTATELLETAGDPDLTLGEWLDRERYGRVFRDFYVIPMGSAIWSTSPADMLRFPARTFVRFLHNHGMLSIRNRPTWRTIPGGSRRYVQRIVRPFAPRLHMASPVLSVRRPADREGVELVVGEGGVERTTTSHFDGVVLAVHADQALRMLGDGATTAEREVLSAIPFVKNDTVLHTDIRLMPATRRAWASWNVHVPAATEPHVAVTYDMNILQGLRPPEELLVTLNRTEAIDPSRILQRFDYEHPMFITAGVRAQRRFTEISGVDGRTWYCGAWWRYGFHEDGVRSGLAVAAQFGMGLEPRDDAPVAAERSVAVEQVLAP
jgi:predicted NAD/FAD-binding protein